MNKRIVRAVLAGVAAALFAVGCASSPQVAYYSLYAPDLKPTVQGAASGGAPPVSVGPVTLPDILKQTQIATGGGDGRYRLAEYHRWSGELDRDLARAVAEQLAGRLGTEQVALFPWDQNITPARRVLIDVLSMGGDPGQEATLTVRWSVIDPQGKLPPLVRRSELREAPVEAGYPAWVAAQQRNVVRLGEEVAVVVKGSYKP